MTSNIRPGKLIALIPAGGSLSDLAAKMRNLQAEHPDVELRMSGGAPSFEVRAAGDPCGCHRCLNDDREVRTAANPEGGFLLNLGFAGMVVCSECGNKRCPHAADHNLACTGSNDAGQPGSAYPAGPLDALPARDG